jgi:hypothetical protein
MARLTLRPLFTPELTHRVSLSQGNRSTNTISFFSTLHSTRINIVQTNESSLNEAKAVPLHATEALGGKEV